MRTRDEVIFSAKAIVSHGDNIAYPSRVSARHVREVMAELLALVPGASEKVYSDHLAASLEPNDQIKHMVDRFLGWRLPKDFNPDCGISATRPNYAPNVEWIPTGTNLFDATQAEAMVRYMVAGLAVPSADCEPLRAIDYDDPITVPSADREADHG